MLWTPIWSHSLGSTMTQRQRFWKNPSGNKCIYRSSWRNYSYLQSHSPFHSFSPFLIPLPFQLTSSSLSHWTLLRTYVQVKMCLFFLLFRVGRNKIKQKTKLKTCSDWGPIWENLTDFRVIHVDKELIQLGSTCVFLTGNHILRSRKKRKANFRNTYILLKMCTAHELPWEQAPAQVEVWQGLTSLVLPPDD